MTLEVGYFVEDAGVAAAFYTGALECVEVAQIVLPESLTRPSGLGGPTRIIALKAPNGTVLKFLEGAGGFGHATAHDSHDHYLTFYTEAFDETSERMLAAGATALTDRPADIPDELGGGRMRFLTDPQGNAIELIERRPQA